MNNTQQKCCSKCNHPVPVRGRLGFCNDYLCPCHPMKDSSEEVKCCNLCFRKMWGKAGKCCQIDCKCHILQKAATQLAEGLKGIDHQFNGACNYNNNENGKGHKECRYPYNPGVENPEGEQCLKLEEEHPTPTQPAEKPRCNLAHYFGEGEVVCTCGETRREAEKPSGDWQKRFDDEIGGSGFFQDALGIENYNRIKTFIESVRSQALQEGSRIAQKELAQEMIDLSDKIENENQTEFNEWRAFKRFRNSMRDLLKKLL